VLLRCLHASVAASEVGLKGFEPSTFRPPAGRATKLRHSPCDEHKTTGRVRIDAQISINLGVRPKCLPFKGRPSRSSATAHDLAATTNPPPGRNPTPPGASSISLQKAFSLLAPLQSSTYGCSKLSRAHLIHRCHSNPHRGQVGQPKPVPARVRVGRCALRGTRRDDLR
jgi:hypothetical protein